MEETKEFKRRSYLSCISAAYRFVAGDFLNIYKSNWKIFFTFAVASGILGTWGMTLAPGATYIGIDLEPTELTLCGVLVAVLNLVLAAAAYSGINKRGNTWNIMRSLKFLPFALAFVLLYAVITAVACFMYLSQIKDPASVPLLTVLGIAGCVGLVWIFVCLPLSYVNVKYMVEPETDLTKIFGSSYVVGIRHIWFIFTTNFLAVLCACIVRLVLCLPVFVMLFALNISSFGTAAYGDESGMPGYFIPLYLLFSLVAGLVDVYIAVFVIRVNYHVYETIGSKIKTANEKIDNKQMN